MYERPRICYPVHPHFVTQRFGANEACVKNFGRPDQKIVSVDANLGTCPPGYELLYPKFGQEGHNGLDLRAGRQPCHAALPGTVIEKQVVPARGLGISILTDQIHDLGEYGEHYLKLRYWHLKSFAPGLEVGDHVQVGEFLGITDSTGYSSANHLHFEGQAVNKDEGSHPHLANPRGHIKGAINIEPFFVGVYAKDLQPDISVLQQTIRKLQAILATYKK